MSQENSNQQPQDNNKVQKSFESNLGKLKAILGDESKLKPQTKIDNSEVAAIVESVFAEQKEQLALGVKTGIQNLLKQYVAFNQALKDKEQELVKLKADKQKEFNQAANQLFQKIDNISKLEADYASALSDMSGQTEGSEEEQD